MPVDAAANLAFNAAINLAVNALVAVSEVVVVAVVVVALVVLDGVAGLAAIVSPRTTRPPLPMVRLPLDSALGEVATRAPARTDVPPVKVLTPERVSVPAPDLISVPVLAAALRGPSSVTS